MSIYEDANKAGKETVDNALKSLSVVTGGLQQLVAQAAEHGKQNYEQSAQLFEKLAQAKSVDRAFEVQSEFAKASYERWVSQTTKMTELFADIGKDAYRPFETTLGAMMEKGAATARSVG